MSKINARWGWFLGLVIAVGGSEIGISTNCAIAQITPDTTLPSNSIVKPIGSTSEIEGGTQEGGNLFHSFQEFSIPTGNTVRFKNAQDIQNIISRVTGGSISNIDGLIRANGTANLFLLNPSGIIFGPNARLDIGGSFVGSTASSIKFADNTQFSATAPQTTPLLTISTPLGLQFGSTVGSIVNRSRATNSSDGIGLQVKPGKTLALVGGNVNLEGATMLAPGGRVELGAAASSETVGFTVNGNNSSLSFPSSVARADIALTDGSFVGVAAGGGGNIAINARNIDVVGGSYLFAGIESSSADVVAGDITLDATEKIVVKQSSNIINEVSRGAIGSSGNINIDTKSLDLENAFLSASTFGKGNGGSVKIDAPESVTIGNSQVLSLLEGEGNSSGIGIKTGSLTVANSSVLDSSTYGKGNGGSVKIDASGFVTIDRNSQVLSLVKGESSKGGDINIIAGSFSLTDGAKLSASTFEPGDGGSVFVKAIDSVSLINGSIFSTVESRAVANGGKVEINAASLSLKNGARIDVGTRGSGDGGKVNINAQKEILLDNANNNGLPTSILANVEEGAKGNAGNINITTGNLSVTNGALIESRVRGTGDGGQIKINANDKISFDGSRGIFNSGIYNTIEPGGKGDGGNIKITTGSLSLTDRATLSTRTFGQGDAGDVKIDVTGALKIEGVNTDINTTAIFSSADSGATGKAGNINITANSVSLNNQGNLYAQAQNNAVGNAGNITIETESFSAAGTSQVAVNSLATGNAGKIKIKAREFSMTSNAALRADVDLNGKASEPGSIDLIVDGIISMIGGQTEIAPTGESTRITLGILPRGKGPGGNLTIKANSLVLKDGASIKASTQGEGAAGNININTNVVDISGSSPISGLASGLFTSTDTSSNAGDIIINTETFRIADSAGLSARTRGNGQGGNITVNARYFEAINGGQLLTTTSGNGQAGKILIDAKDRINISGIDQKYNNRVAQVQANEKRIRLDPERTEFRLSSIANNFTETGAASGLFAQTDSSGDAGNIIITTQELNLADQAQISAATSSRGQGGNINIQSNSLTLNRGEISALAQGLGNAGSITINVNGLLNATDSKIVTSATQSSGGASAIKAGNIRLYGNSDITTNVESGAGGGGNITLTANSIIAFGDSDILAFARDGQGGKVTLNTPAFFGQNYKAALFGTEPSTLDGNNRVDINASGAIPGTITLPDTSFIQNSLSELPENLIDTGSLIANSCIARANSQQQGTFIITGSGALPSRPGDALMSQYTFGSVRTNNVSASSRRPWQKGDPIIEPQGAYRLPSGRLVLSRECG